MIKIKKNYLKLIPVFIIFVLIFKFIYNDNGIGLLFKICIPVFGGLFFAIVLNPILTFIQKRLKIKSRALSIIITYLLFIVLLTLLIVIVVPSISESISDFVSDLPAILNTLTDKVISLTNEWFKGDNSAIYSIIEKAIATLTQKIYNIASTVLNTAISSAISLLSALWQIIISLFISIYILSDKEHFQNLFIKFCNSVFEKKNAEYIIDIGYKLYANVTNFISGKCLDSFIIGCIAYIISAYLIKAKYSLLIAVMIGVTNMIPYFGPFIGGVPAVILTLLFDPMKGVWMGISVIIIQQFDGWFLGPKILGIKLDLKPLWIIISIIIGGGLFGAIGMFLATPVAALIATLMNGYMTLKLKDKQINLTKVEK